MQRGGGAAAEGLGLQGSHVRSPGEGACRGLSCPLQGLWEAACRLHVQGTQRGVWSSGTVTCVAAASLTMCRHLWQEKCSDSA